MTMPGPFWPGQFWPTLRKRITLPALAFAAIGLVVALIPAAWLPAALFGQPAERTIRVEAADFAFTPAVLRANPGDRVTIELVAKDVTHGLSIDGYPVDVLAEPGQTARVSFVADRVGSYKIRCSMPCGNLHPFMTGRLEVGPNLLLARALILGVLAFAFGAWSALR